MAVPNTITPSDTANVTHDLSTNYQVASAVDVKGRFTGIFKPPQGPKTMITAAPHHTHTVSSSTMSGDRLRPLTPIYGRGSNLSTSPRRRLMPAFTIPPSVSEPSSPGLRSTSIQMTPSRDLRSTSTSRDRAGSQSRSSSLPNAVRISEARSDPPTSSPSSGRNTPRHPRSRGSVKHLTCFWWKEKGACKLSDEECLYAHYDTGNYTQPPRQLFPGQPAVAGRNLDRAIKKLEMDHTRSSSSLSSMAVSRPTTPGAPSIDSSQTLVVGNDWRRSRDSEVAVLQDNHFLRELVEQGSREKAALLSTIESLETTNKDLKQESDLFKSERQRLLNERDMLRNALSEQISRRPTYNPFGVIGGEVRPPVSTGNTAQLQNENEGLKNILRNYGMSF